MSCPAVPYELRQEGGRSVLRATGASTTEEERTLAGMLEKAFGVAATQPNAWKQIVPKLAEIARLGLCDAVRKPAQARRQLDALDLKIFSGPISRLAAAGPPQAALPADPHTRPAPIIASPAGETAGMPAIVPPLPSPPPPSLPTLGAYLVTVDHNDHDALHVRPTLGGPAPTEEQLAFLSELDRQDRLIRTIFTRSVRDQGKQREAIRRAAQRLAMAAGLGLQDSRPNVRVARIGCDSALQDALGEHGVAIRAKYLGALGRAYVLGALAVVLLAMIYGALVWGMLPPPISPMEIVLPKTELVMLVIAMVSLACGAWLAAVVFVEPDGAEVIGSIFSTTLNATMRATYVLGFGFIALLLLHKKAVIFAIGAPGGGFGFSTELALAQLSSAVITGALLGVGARALPNAVVERSASLVAALSSK